MEFKKKKFPSVVKGAKAFQVCRCTSVLQQTSDSIQFLVSFISQAEQIQDFYSTLIEDYLGTYQVHGTKN